VGPLLKHGSNALRRDPIHLFFEVERFELHIFASILACFKINVSKDLQEPKISPGMAGENIADTLKTSLSTGVVASKLPKEDLHRLAKIGIVGSRG